MFLKTYWDGKAPLLLGYSGGPDSKALLYILKGLPIHVAHVDHGWRQTSGAEAEELKREVEGLGFPFHMTRLEGCKKEEEAREARLEFFRKLCEQVPFQALLLAHQADDWAETALKRVLEGSHLPFLGGMDPVSHIKGLCIWRPLLKIPKQGLEKYLDQKGLIPLRDPTNTDPKYLRSRMRVDMIPYLSRSLGKEVAGNLTLLAERASELKEYLDRKVRGKQLHELTERVERRYLMQLRAKAAGKRLSREALEALLDQAENVSS